MVECSPATRAARVRFPDDASTIFTQAFPDPNERIFRQGAFETCNPKSRVANRRFLGKQTKQHIWPIFCRHVFEEFVAFANDSDLEDVLTLQTKLYRCAHIFLGKCLPPASGRKNSLLRTAYGISPDRFGKISMRFSPNVEKYISKFEGI